MLVEKFVDHYLQKKTVPWAQFAHHCMQMFSWENLKNYTFTTTLLIFQRFTVDL